MCPELFGRLDQSMQHSVWLLDTLFFYSLLLLPAARRNSLAPSQLFVSCETRTCTLTIFCTSSFYRLFNPRQRNLLSQLCQSSFFPYNPLFGLYAFSEFSQPITAARLGIHYFICKENLPSFLCSFYILSWLWASQKWSIFS